MPEILKWMKDLNDWFSVGEKVGIKSKYALWPFVPSQYTCMCSQYSNKVTRLLILVVSYLFFTAWSTLFQVARARREVSTGGGQGQRGAGGNVARERPESNMGKAG